MSKSQNQTETIREFTCKMDLIRYLEKEVRDYKTALDRYLSDISDVENFNKKYDYLDLDSETEVAFLLNLTGKLAVSREICFLRGEILEEIFYSPAPREEACFCCLPLLSDRKAYLKDCVSRRKMRKALNKKGFDPRLIYEYSLCNLNAFRAVHEREN